MMNLDEMIDHAINFARSQLIGLPDAELMPMWLIQGQEQDVIVGTPFDGPKSKDMAAEKISQLLREERATSYSYMAEAWSAIENVDHPIGLAPRDREDRREVVLVMARNRAGESKTRVWEIIRGPDGVVTELKANAAPSDGSFSGRFHNLFDEK